MCLADRRLRSARSAAVLCAFAWELRDLYRVDRRHHMALCPRSLESFGEDHSATSSVSMPSANRQQEVIGRVETPGGTRALLAVRGETPAEGHGEH
jgi:hypothetical protein